MSITCENIHKSYRNTTVLKGIELEIADGEYIALMGKSGAGKSTLLNIMAGLDHPSSGRVMYNGLDLGKCNDEQLAKVRLKEFGFIFQFFNLIPELTLLENIVLPIELDGKKIDKKLVDYIIEQLGLTSRKNSMPAMLSGGEQQRAAIARAMILMPKVVFADEPTGNLDEESSKVFLELIKNVRNQFNTTIVLVTHDSTVAGYADKVYRICDGIISRDG